MLKATLELCSEYDLEARSRSASLAKKTLEQIHREYLEALFTAARRHRLDIWDFAQKFMDSPVSLRLDKAETLLTTESELLFRDFSIYCVQNHIELAAAPDANAGMNAFRTISPEAKWLAAIYSAWHAKTGEAGREIAERAPASLLRKICKKAMKHPTEDVLELLLDYSAEAAEISPADCALLEKARAERGGE